MRPNKFVIYLCNFWATSDYPLVKNKSNNNNNRSHYKGVYDTRLLKCLAPTNMPNNRSAWSADQWQYFMDGIANHFPATNALDCTILHIQSQHFLGDTPGSPQKRPRCLDPDTNFRLARRRSHCFTKRPHGLDFLAPFWVYASGTRRAGGRPVHAQIGDRSVPT